jgi:hypothetical protein
MIFAVNRLWNALDIMKCHSLIDDFIICNQICNINFRGGKFVKVGSSIGLADDVVFGYIIS